MGNSILEQRGYAKREQLPVAVQLTRKPATNPWISVVWEVSGIVAGDGLDRDAAGITRVHEADGETRYLATGLSLRLHRDECESYYYNLVSESPTLFVVCRDPDSESDVPMPFLLTASFDAAAAYSEVDTPVHTVAMPPPVYEWVEAFVLDHYVPVKRIKRKLEGGNSNGNGGDGDGRE